MEWVIGTRVKPLSLPGGSVRRVGSMPVPPGERPRKQVGFRATGPGYQLC